ncbi:saccharopine dehydrogenase NADP-binding domain-containing protein [Dyadobacter alkalitolerans]|uniref:saccharopine dehydrogenase NADP-binding domain-containing protein n=1 Tax=Dyadobacter alkalitolerans TaxID=492736 RepID=UPI00040AECCF|nr:saccharopine dehydrogenase NADP-binding domain-containing protein [Dyadobacter alkalitolerans]
MELSNEVAGAKLLIYGATGYTGTMICYQAVRRGLNFEIAGRDRDKLLALSLELNVPYHVFSVDDKSGWEKALLGKTCLLNVAGPFSETAQLAMQACISHKVHYVDITAEIDIYRLAESKGSEATTAGIMILSGAGLFATYDPLVLHTAGRIKDPIFLRAAFKYSGGFTPGSIASSANIINAGVLVRRNGLVQQLSQAGTAEFDFGDGPEECLPTPLGGVVLCYRSTGIINIEEYFQMALPASTGPSDTIKEVSQKAAGENLPQSKILAEVMGANGLLVRSMAIMPAGYMPTVKSAVDIVSRVVNGFYKVGFQSPGSVYGTALLKTLDVEIIDF